MNDCTCGPGLRWCARADAIFGVAGFHVLAVDRQHDERRLVLTVETDADTSGCRRCGVVAVGHGRREVQLHDAPCFGVPVLLRWRKRVWRCPDPDCPVGTFTETSDLASPRTKLTARAVAWAVDALTCDDTTVSALARHLGVDWHTVWDAVEVEATRRLADPARLSGVRTIGVDEHVVRHEALLFWMEVRDLHRFAVAAAG